MPATKARSVPPQSPGRAFNCDLVATACFMPGRAPNPFNSRSEFVLYLTLTAGCVLTTVRVER